MLPSFRDIELRLQRITDVPDLSRALREGAAVIERHGGEYATDELRAAAARLTELHTLATALWHTVRSFGNPPAPPPRPERRPARSIHAVQRLGIADVRPAAPMSPAGTRVHRHQLAAALPLPPTQPAHTPVDAASPTPPPPAAPPGGVLLQDVMALTRRSEPWVYLAMIKQGFPRPIGRVKNRAYWARAAVEKWLADKASSAQPMRAPTRKKATHL